MENQRFRRTPLYALLFTLGFLVVLALFIGFLLIGSSKAQGVALVLLPFTALTFFYLTQPYARIKDGRLQIRENLLLWPSYRIAGIKAIELKGQRLRIQDENGKVRAHSLFQLRAKDRKAFVEFLKGLAD